MALPGTYQVRLTVLGKTYTAPLEIKADPRLKVSQEDLAKQFDLLLKIRDKVTETDDAIIQIRDVREQMNAENKRLKNDPREKTIADAGKALDKKMTEVEEAADPDQSQERTGCAQFSRSAEQSHRCAGWRGRKRRYGSNQAVL